MAFLCCRIAVLGFSVGIETFFKEASQISFLFSYNVTHRPDKTIYSQNSISRTRGEGVNFHYKDIYRRAARMGNTFQASTYMHGYHFYFKKYINGVSFLP